MAKLKITKLLLIPVLMVGFAGCEEEQTPTTANPSLSGDPIKASSGEVEMELDESWEHASSNPIIAAGDFREQAFWNDPCVLPDGNGGYIMYLTTSVGKPFTPPVLPFRAVSPDGLNWRLDPETPLLSEEGTPFVSLETPSVVRFNNQYHMYFTGVYKGGAVPPMAIGHAVSDDGINWSLVDDGRPILEATGTASDWNGYLVGEPGAVVFNDRIYLYFSAVGARPGGNPPQIQVIGLATSEDGHRFENPRKVHGQSDKYSASEGYVGYSTPEPTMADGKVHLFFDVARYDASADPSWFQTALQTAVSEDGIRFEEAKKPFAYRNMSSWTSLEVRSPSALFEDGSWRVWYAGHGDLRELFESLGKSGRAPYFGIGVATSN